MKKRNTKQPFSWKNDAELDKLSALNAKINEGASLDSLRKDFEINEEKVNNLRKEISEQKALLNYFTNLKEKIKIVFEGQPADQDTFLTAKREIERFTKFSVIKEIYRNIYSLIISKESMINRLESELSEKTEELKISADYYTFAQKIAGGTYVQELAYNENIMKLSDYIETGSAIIKKNKESIKMIHTNKTMAAVIFLGIICFIFHDTSPGKIKSYNIAEQNITEITTVTADCSSSCSEETTILTTTTAPVTTTEIITSATTNVSTTEET